MSTNTQTADDAILEKLHGDLEFRLTNAYLFVAVLQENEEALCSLIAALLHIDRKEICSIQILNPIILGQAIDFKDCVLDLLVLLNNNLRINLEMQVSNQGNWDDRSVYYLSTKIATLPKGGEYDSLKPFIQIGILDFNFPNDNTEFYQQIYLMNRKTHQIYSDKVAIHVLCLNQLDKATPEDHASGLYQWAKIFKATTWKELKKLSEENSVIKKTVVTMAQLSADEKIRQQCIARQMYEADHRSIYRTGYNDGEASGIKKGEASGIKRGRKEGKESERNLILTLNQKLIQANRGNELNDALENPQLMDKLIKEFNITTE